MLAIAFSSNVTMFIQLMPFLTEMQKQGFIVVTETAKGVHSIVEVNLTHEEYVII